jgi:hypothetical protein
MAVDVRTRSRLRFGELVVSDGVEFWDLLDLPTLAARNDDLSYQVQSHDRIDSIANKFYGDPVLWWVIAVANDMEILPTELNTGDILRIPEPNFVLESLFDNALVR